jgi:hypothetical protein
MLDFRAAVIQMSDGGIFNEGRKLIPRSRLVSESNGKTLSYSPLMTNPIEHSEGPVARAIEEQTAKLPSDAFLWAAGASIATSLILKVLDRHHEALFVGQWAPTILILGLYNKLVKQHGSDPFHA